ncbi:MAG: electron transfer flavoprotein subunit beta/FixA family protein, partial [Thermoplasmata archaeon]
MAPNIVVCLKQIPNPDLQFQVSADGKDIRRDALNYKVNGADEYALEEAVRLKEKHGGKVTAITAGPKRTEQMLREAIAKGADAAVRISFEDPTAIDPFQ